MPPTPCALSACITGLMPSADSPATKWAKKVFRTTVSVKVFPKTFVERPSSISAFITKGLMVHAVSTTAPRSSSAVEVPEKAVRGSVKSSGAMAVAVDSRRDERASSRAGARRERMGRGRWEAARRRPKWTAWSAFAVNSHEPIAACSCVRSPLGSSGKARTPCDVTIGPLFRFVVCHVRDLAPTVYAVAPTSWQRRSGCRVYGSVSRSVSSRWARL